VWSKYPHLLRQESAVVSPCQGDYADALAQMVRYFECLCANGARAAEHGHSSHMGVHSETKYSIVPVKSRLSNLSSMPP